MSDTNHQRYERATCRSCAHPGLLPVLDLGIMPLADGLVSSEQLLHAEKTYPLEVAFCPECSLVQILETVPPETLFRQDYPYYSSFSDALLAHSRKNALNLVESRKLNSQSLVVELASNDGYLLRNFVEKGIPVLGIDPAQGPARAAEKVGVPTLCDFFGRTLASQLKGENKRADVIVANNVLAHVADTNGFVDGIGILLKDDGVAVIEVPYVRNLIDHREFDTIYHEHLCYFSATAIDRLFRRHGLYLVNVERLSIHGGSLRLYIEKKENVQPAVTSLLEEEKRLGIDQYPYYQSFGREVEALRTALRALCIELKNDGKTIAAYGAAAKGSTMVNYVGLGRETIEYVVDRNIHKQGKFMPGVRIPIHDPAKLAAEMPDYVLLLPWNFKDEILAQQDGYRKKGGRFIVPIPSPVIV